MRASVAFQRWNGVITGRNTELFRPLSVRSYLQSTDEQGREDVLRLVVSPDADATTGRGNMRVIVRRHIILAPVGSMHHKRLEWLGSQSVANVFRHN